MSKQYTEKQLEVINISSGYNMVLAGPGCGKTDILAERIAKAYEQDNKNLSDMLCLTFTNRAARGMFERIRARLGSESDELFVGNIHRYCSHFLFDNKIVSAEASVLDEDDSSEIISSEISTHSIEDLIELELEDKDWGLYSVNWDIVNDFLGIKYTSSGSSGLIKRAKVDSIISAVKYKIPIIQTLIYQVLNNHPEKDFYYLEYLENNLIPYGFVLKSNFIDACHCLVQGKSFYDADDYRTKILNMAYQYLSYKQRNGLLDFDDLLLYTYNAYYNDINKELPRYSWIQIDEIQDLSFFQLSLVDLFTDLEKDFVVLYLGDEQQAIYSFMGASLNSLNMLKERCSNIYRLDKNFRSPKYLLDIYNEYAVKELKVDPDFLPQPKDNKIAGFYDVCIHRHDSEEEEVDRLYDVLLPFLRQEERANERTAILVSWNRDADKISNHLTYLDFNHFKISGTDSFQSVHMKTLMAHFNAVNNEFNFIAWSRILKQTGALDTYKDARRYIENMRKIGMCPSDLLRNNGTYLSEFVDIYDNKEIVVFDTETTGVDVFNDDIIQIAAFKIFKGEIVPNSFFNIIIETDKDIPQKLGREINPMVKIYNEAAIKYSHEEGLSLFLDYIGDCILLGHNVNFDYNILKHNILKYCNVDNPLCNNRTIDSLKLAHLICPRLRKYKLGFLVEILGLKPKESESLNFHLADEDIKATLCLVNYFRGEANKLLLLQKDFLNSSTSKEVVYVLKQQGYYECYLYTKNNLFELHDENSPFAIIQEMEYATNELKVICEFRPVNSFNHILTFLSKDVILILTQNQML